MREWESGPSRVRVTLARLLSRLTEGFRNPALRLVRRKTCHFLMPQPDEVEVCPTLFSVQMRLKPRASNVVESSVYDLGEFEAGTIHALLGLLPRGGVFLDVGANIGFLSCSVARLLGDDVTVFAVEPHPDTFDYLGQNIRLNGLENVRTLNVALGGHDSEAKIYDDPQEDRGAATLVPPTSGPSADGMMVKVRTVDTLIRAGTIAVPDVIKIDVEGFELQVLKGAEGLLSGPDAPALCVEYSLNHPQSAGETQDIFRFLKSVNRYRIFKLAHGREVPSALIEIRDATELPHADNIFSLLDHHAGAITD